jgi:DNA-binding IclR family transcriptional regulator
MDANEQVLDALKKSGKPMKSAEIAEGAGLDKKAVDKALKDLKTQGKINSPKNCYYAFVK